MPSRQIMPNRNQMQLQDKIGAKIRFSRAKSEKSALSMLFQRKRRKNNRTGNKISIKISQNIQFYRIEFIVQKTNLSIYPSYLKMQDSE
ncbi:hypothetical protein PBPRA2639 [Photobacterium profundum SS9]|uniref:Uncharacterized protein n=1 Tax=Photobacterium profundum (strain SS9) TaxID=298386 RepID=Q6LNV8_PHOPR|nr:hypothetical protein PBPRA2639 [Photobacterium profundum SS9]